VNFIQLPQANPEEIHFAFQADINLAFIKPSYKVLESMNVVFHKIHRARLFPEFAIECSLEERRKLTKLAFVDIKARLGRTNV
ncbi:MAG: hypothetical protein LQ349_000150, partial [Xanthoria aureola]